MGFEVEIYYVTGDSFGSHEETEMLGPVFEDLEQARVAARRIREHYDWYKSLEGYKPSKIKQPDWHRNAYGPQPDRKNWRNDHSNRLFFMCGEREIEVVPFWTGYFERLLQVTLKETTFKSETY